MSENLPPLNLDDQVIDVEPLHPKRHGLRLLILALVVLAIVLFSSISIYVESLWFGSLGFASVYWYTFRLKLLLFLVFAVLTLVILRAGFRLLERAFASTALERRTVIINNQQVTINPARFLRPLAWIVSAIFAIIYGLGMSEEWQSFALYLNQAQTEGHDPIFGKSVGFYLFSLPVYQMVVSWLTTVAVILLIATIVYALLTVPQKQEQRFVAAQTARATAYSAISFALAGVLLTIAAQVYLSRYTYLWDDHEIFSGVTYTEANYLLPGLVVVAVALVAAAVILLFNALRQKRLRLMLIAVGLPVAVYVVAGLLIPGYVTSFIVKPNQLGRETPYIEHNIEWTRRAFRLEGVESRGFEAEPETNALAINDNRATVNNIRLWDWRALQATLDQIQQIRTYYDFPDVDVDRYKVNGETQQMMVAARELDVNALPEQSRNWINERFIYTHGYGATMNTSNGFTPEGMPQFLLSDMPIQASAPEIKITRPEIYYGQKTDTPVYVKTRQKEFDYPQGEANQTTTYQGTGGISIGSSFRRFLIAWTLGDMAKLPFSDDITPESRVLMRRNISERVREVAPFLIYDHDPYLIVTDDGRLVWMIDAYTESSTYPYSRHHDAADVSVNYMRNSVKATVDAYNGTVTFYVFDAQDPLINSWRKAYPALFHDAGEMPADVRAHIRYPETFIRTQGEVYSLYHTQNAKVFFQREDVWSVARQSAVGKDKQQTAEPLEPYFVLMQLPGEQSASEFVEIVLFTPVSRNNMIGWMAGRSDGANYGSLLVYNFPTSRIVDGPLQIAARIDQNAQLSSQLTLWNQQGSKVLRGNLLVIPIGRGLLYVEPIYLQAESSPMPELRIVVLATQEKLAYGANFAEAMTNLFGESKPPDEKQAEQAPTPVASKKAGEPVSQTPSTNALAQGAQQLIERANAEFADYERLSREGKYGEAGQKLEALKKTLAELQKAEGKKQ
ncbi:MAG: UPF0182 family protein [Acidobacteria bacterium]|nr:UPF0182 family protein [Acidobacteriota bacterium]